MLIWLDRKALFWYTEHSTWPIISRKLNADSLKTLLLAAAKEHEVLIEAFL